MFFKNYSALLRVMLFIVWCFFLVTNLVMVFSLYNGEYIESDNFQQVIKQLSVSYMPYMAAMLGYVALKQSNRRGKAGGDVGVWRLFASLVGSIVWNGCITFILFQVYLLKGTIEQAVEQISFLSYTLSWLPAIALGISSPVVSQQQQSSKKEASL